MKYIFVIFILSILNGNLYAQENPVNWEFTVNKKSKSLYEIHLFAKIKEPWHIYSEVQPKDAIATPTIIKVTPNPLVQLQGKTIEVGNRQNYYSNETKTSALQYLNQVDFVQTVRLKADVKTSIRGTITFQVCNDEKCLPPKTIPFFVTLN